MSRNVVNVSNPAAYGLEWTTETGNRYQLAWVRGTDTLLFGAKLPDGGWSLTSITNDSFRPSPNATPAEVDALMRAFIDYDSE